MNYILKFLVYLLGYTIYPFSFCIPRSKNKWAFGSFRGAFNDNTKYLFIYTTENHPEVDAAWISPSKQTVRQLRSLGLKSYYIGSIKGLLHALRSKYWFFNSYSSDILFFASGNAICTNLWHGLSLKSVEFSIKSGKLANRYVKKTLRERFYYPQCYTRPNYLISSTDFQSVKFAEAFRINLSQCLNIGYPRNTILTASEEERQRFIKKYEPHTAAVIARLAAYQKVFLYMPTWRDSQVDIFSRDMNLDAVNKLMAEQNSLFMLKPHANTKVDTEKLSSYSHVMLIDNRVDIYTIAPYTNVLITDYSSILYDYILMNGKNVILYLYDFNDFVEIRNLNYPFLENVVGREVYNLDDLLTCLKSGDYKIDKEKREEVIVKFWGKNWNKTIAEVSEEIIRKTIRE